MMRPQLLPGPGRAVPSRHRRPIPEDHPASIPPSPEFPVWDSFPTADRRLLINLIIQTACRQIRLRPMSQPGQERG
jgi:hypothetical protein